MTYSPLVVSSTAAANPAGPASSIAGTAEGVLGFDHMEHETDTVELAADASPTRSAPIRWEFEIMGPAAQGPDLWWYLQLNGTVEFERDAASNGIVYLWADVNGKPAASLKYFLDGDGPINGNSVNYEGQSEFRSESSTLDFEFRNVIAIDSVRPGKSEITVWLETLDHPGGVRAQIDGTSALSVEQNSPIDLSVVFGKPKSVGDTVEVAATITNSDDSPANDVRVTVTAVDSHTQVLSPSGELKLGTLDGSRTFQIDLRPAAGQKSSLVVAAAGTERNDAVAVPLEVAHEVESPWPDRLWTATLGLLLMLGCVLVAKRFGKARS